MKEITKVLIPNRGEIACRILRTLDRMDIPGVVVYHAVDVDSPAVRMVADAMEIDAPTPVAAYLDMEAIIDACKQTGADAVHPGFGFLADAHGDFAERARAIGVPLLIKAASGGGGKGMHIVRELCDLDQAVFLAKGEALRSFGDNEVYAERYVDEPRHIEVQVLADQHGNVLHLGERECSIQRRFQKIVEESPAPALCPELREQICATAVAITRRAGYRNAGTVEFILAPNNEFYFLEMNTRLQVEHPVTEMVTGLDLVELQIRVARGETLPLTQGEVQANGHAVELRVYAEDPENDFLPATGPLLVYRTPMGEGVRVENGFARG